MAWGLDLNYPALHLVEAQPFGGVNMRGLSILLVAASIALGLSFIHSAEPPAPGDLAGQVKNFFSAHCYRCHGRDGTNEGGFNFILRTDKLLAGGKYVVPKEPDQSLLYQRLADHSMPPEEEMPRPGPRDLDLVKKWILAGAPDANPAGVRRPAVLLTEIFRLLREDLESAPSRDRRFRRYFTAQHLANAGLSDDELLTYRHALSKLLNSLSWNKNIVLPKPLDPAGTLFRIDLRDYHWTESTWERILSHYPYALIPQVAEVKTACELTGSRLPLLRADWFVAAGSVPPLYEEILDLPQSDRELEQQLRISVETNIHQDRVARAGFNGSGISQHNRLIERHESIFGAYWKSYDFGSSAGRGNLFANPFGPGKHDKAFQCDGGEIIFSLPNGLQAFMIVDGTGRRISKAPASIVSDPKRPDRAVVNGLSCMSCHTRGIIPKEDQVREAVRQNPRAFTLAERETVEALFPPRREFAQLQQQDSLRYCEAVAKTGGRAGRTEPIVTLAQRFEAPLDLGLAAAEMNLPTSRFLAGLDSSPRLARTLGTLKLPGGTVQRSAFTENFREAVQELNLGSVLTRTVSIPVPSNPRVTPPRPTPGDGVSPERVIALNATLNDLTLSADRKWLYFLDLSAGELRRLNTGSLTVDDRVARLTDGTEQMRRSPDGKTLYTCAAPNGHDHFNGNKGGKFQVVDARTLEVRATITTPFSPWDMACDDRGMLYVTIGGGQSTFLPVIDTQKKTVVAEWMKNLWHRTLIRITPDHKKLYLSVTDLSPPSIESILVPEQLAPGPKTNSRGGGGGKYSMLPDGKMIVLATGQVMRISHSPEGDLKNVAGIVPHLCLAADTGMKHIFVATKDKVVKVYSYPDFDVVGSFQTRDLVYRMAYDETSGLLYCATAAKDLSGRLMLGVGNLEIYDVTTVRGK